jgi:lipopolysaccharide transport system ATP-binding protein
MSDIAISVRNVGKCFAIYDKTYHPLLNLLYRGRRKFHRDFWALADVSFVVNKGETVGIIGRNGSGKSTLLQLLCGIYAPTTGSIEVVGRVAALLELGSGFNPAFTGRENVYMQGLISGMTQEEISERLDEIAAFADIGEFIEQPVKTYSSGMLVRLAFATSIHVSPDILVVDEALAVGDTAFQSKCLGRIRKMQRDGVSILLVTHSNNTVNEYCDRALYLKRGNLISDGPSRPVTESYAADLVKEEGGRSTPVDAETEEAPGSEILRVSIENAAGQEVRVIHQGERFQVRLQVRYNRDVEFPALGIQIKSSTDIELWSATTLRLGVSLGPVGAGETKDYAWSLDATMGADSYVIALGSGDVESGNYKRHFRLHYATHFEVTEDKPSGWGWLSPRPDFKILPTE